MIVNLADIRFPVYQLGTDKPESLDNVLFYLFIANAGTEDEVIKITIIDDKNVPGDSLATRRLQLATQDRKLHPLKKAVFFLPDFLKVAKKSTWFIDSNGVLFQYTKQKRVPLVFRKISKIINMSTGGSIVEVQGVPGRFKTLFTAPKTATWAGLLVMGNGTVLYGLYDNEYRATTRQV